MYGIARHARGHMRRPVPWPRFQHNASDIYWGTSYHFFGRVLSHAVIKPPRRSVGEHRMPSDLDALVRRRKSSIQDSVRSAEPTVYANDDSEPRMHSFIKQPRGLVADEADVDHPHLGIYFMVNPDMHTSERGCLQ
ncbi:hypothetical protein C8Q70DRAFT_520298 [Cubamyces menziesii]|nr:hypothetical protein C8Q70DRAFT_520298 [Cubamyces menziesii]